MKPLPELVEAYHRAGEDEYAARRRLEELEAATRAARKALEEALWAIPRHAVEGDGDDGEGEECDHSWLGGDCVKGCGTCGDCLDTGTVEHPHNRSEIPCSKCKKRGKP